MIGPLCALRWAWRSLAYRHPVDGCTYAPMRFPQPDNVLVLRCRSCGKRKVVYSFASLAPLREMPEIVWHLGGEPTYVNGDGVRG